MKKILLIGNIRKEDSAINNLFKRRDYKIFKANNTSKAIKFLNQNSPDFILCTGKIQMTNEGYYFLEL